jgi:surface polysaccharide O-acyltransferase-like enzyme
MKRESNIELLRIIAMILVVLVHCNYFSLGPVAPEAIAAAPLDSFVKAFAEQLCIICVNVFILISGWFGIRPSLKGVASFLYRYCSTTS